METFVKKLALTTLIFLTCGAIQALPVGNPADPMLYQDNLWFGDCQWHDCTIPNGKTYDLPELHLGYYGDYVFNRRLQAKEEAGTVELTTIFTNAGLVVVNFYDWFEFFATVGVSNFYSRSTANNTNAPGVEIELGFSPTMSYSGGLRVPFWCCDCLYFGLEAQYFFSRTELDWLESMNNGTFTHFGHGADRNGDYSEWQASIAGSYIFVDMANFAFIPYAALQFSGVNWNLEKMGGNAIAFQDQKQQRLLGWTIGVTALFCDLLGVSVEGRFVNEKALSVLGQISF